MSADAVLILIVMGIVFIISDICHAKERDACNTLHTKEREDLYNRIMAGSLQDYVRGSHSDSSHNSIANGIKKVVDNQYKQKT